MTQELFWAISAANLIISILLTILNIVISLQIKKQNKRASIDLTIEPTPKS